jgi:hypothetical protein
VLQKRRKQTTEQGHGKIKKKQEQTEDPKAGRETH